MLKLELTSLSIFLQISISLLGCVHRMESGCSNYFSECYICISLQRRLGSREGKRMAAVYFFVFFSVGLGYSTRKSESQLFYFKHNYSILVLQTALLNLYF